MPPPAGSCDRMLGGRAHAPLDTSRTSASGAGGRHRRSPLRPRSTRTPAMPSDVTVTGGCPCSHPPCGSSPTLHVTGKTHTDSHRHTHEHTQCPTSIHTHVCTHRHTHGHSQCPTSHVSTHRHTHEHAQLPTYTHTLVSTHRHATDCSCPHTCTNSHTCTPAQLHTHAHAHTHILKQACTRAHT